MAALDLARDLAFALDPARLATALALDPDPWQAEFLRNPSRRLLLNCSRQSGKHPAPDQAGTRCSTDSRNAAPRRLHVSGPAKLAGLSANTEPEWSASKRNGARKAEFHTPSSETQTYPQLIVRAETRKGQVKQKNETPGADPAPPMRGVRIEIGIGTKPEAGYLHCDITYRPGVDCICDAAQLPFADHVASQVFNRHLLEHLDAETAARAVREWHRVLRLGGVLDINVPDLAVHCIQLARPGSSRYLLRTYRTLVSNHEHALRSIFGWQQDQHHYHSWGYTTDSLCRLLGQAGFCDITRIDDGMFCNIRFVAHKGVGDSTFRDRRPITLRLRGAWNAFLALLVAKLTF